MRDYDEAGPMRHDDPSTWPEVVYEPLGKITLRGSLAELWSYREVAWSFGMRKIRTRYKQAAFGFLWAVVQPLAFLALFMGFLGSGRNGPGSYAAGTFAALVAWQFVNSAIAGAGSSLVNEAGLLRKVFFPRECVVLGVPDERWGQRVVAVVVPRTPAPTLDELRDHVGATLDLWHADAATVATGSKFVVWYDGDVGQGVVTSMRMHS